MELDDLSQEIQIKIWDILKSEKKVKHHSSYIKKVVYSSVIDMIRKVDREKEVLSQYGNRYKEDTSTPDRTKHEEIRQLIASAVGSLIEPRRNVVKLHLLGMAADEIASFLKWSPNKVRNLLYRGLADVKEILKENGVDYEA